MKVPDEILIGFSTRTGGVSPSPWDSLNMSVSTGDLAGNVDRNRELFCQTLGFAMDDLAQPIQISRDGVARAQKPGRFADCDALYTGETGVMLSILTADCSPVLIWSAKPVFTVAAVHSGWQGSELDILGKTIRHLIREYNVPVEKIHMVIGPGLSQEHFEVGPEFQEKFPAAFLQATSDGSHYLFDNNGLLKSRALTLGVPESQVEILPYCSYADERLFFSHRRDRGRTGRMISVIGIRK